MSPDFVQTYRSLVVPRLKARFDICAGLILSGVSSFSAEIGRLEDQARRLGGSYLGERHWRSLEEWIATQVIKAIDRIELRQIIPGAHRDIIAIFAEQERDIAALTEANEQLRADLASAWLIAASIREMEPA